MLIKSKFKDYYDNIGGVDRTIIYERKSIHYINHNNTSYIVNKDPEPLEPNSKVQQAFSKLRVIDANISEEHDIAFTLWPGKNWKSLRLAVLIIGNKVFPAIHFDEALYYSYDKFFKVYKELDTEFKGKKYLRFTKERWDSFSKKCKETNFIEIQLLLNTPIFFYRFTYGRFRSSTNHRLDLYINCKLTKYNTVSILDPYQANQEISMFISGVLRQPEAPMIKITDEKMLLQKHGMGPMSFKQGTPGLKKERRRANKQRKTKGE